MDDVDDSGARPTAPERVTGLAMDLLADFAPFGAGRADLEAGLEQLAPDATEAEVHEALSAGILRGMSWSEKRRALRKWHDRNLEARDGPVLDPLVDVSRVEDESGEFVALHVLCSEPDVDVFRDDGSVLLVSPDAYQFRERIAVPFRPFYVDHEDSDGVAEFYVRRREQEWQGDVEDVDGGEDGADLAVEPFTWDDADEEVDEE